MDLAPFRRLLLVTAGALPVLVAVTAMVLDRELLLAAAVALATAYAPAAWALTRG